MRIFSELHILTFIVFVLAGAAVADNKPVATAPNDLPVMIFKPGNSELWDPFILHQEYE